MKADPSTESRLPPDEAFSIYVPRDDRFSDQKLFEFVQHFPKSSMNLMKSFVSAELEKSGKEFESFEQVLKILYQQGFTFNVPKAVLDAIAEKLPIPTPPENGDLLLKFPVPSVIQGMFTQTYTIFNLIMVHILVLVINSNIYKCFFSF